MADSSQIEWTDATWNPVTGCSKVSPGCKNCYAERMAERLRKMGLAKYAQGFQPRYHEEDLHLPLKWKKPKRIFVNSMSDLFHEEVPTDFIRQVADVMASASWHTFQVLTKRPERLIKDFSDSVWPQNVQVGVSVESAAYFSRIDQLRRVKAATRFLSCEPLLGSLSEMDLSGIHWVIVGGESGPRARLIHSAWVREIRDQCKAANVPFFFKQWGGTNKQKAGRLLDGQTWDEFPKEVTNEEKRIFKPA